MKYGKGLKLKYSTWINTLVLFSLLFSVLRDNLSVPSAIRYIIDLSIVTLFFLAIKNKRLRWVEDKTIYIFLIIYIFYTLCIYFVEYISIAYYLNGFLKTFRYYLFFLVCIIFLKENSIQSILKWLNILFYINFIVTIIQFFVFNIHGDYLGGLFGTALGCNGYANSFLIACAAISLMNFIHKKESTSIVLLKIGMVMIIAALASIKFFFIEFLIAGVIMVFLTKFSFRKFILVLLAAGLVFLGMYMVDNLSIYSGNRQIFSIQGFLQYSSSGYSARRAVDRATFIPYINQRFLTSPEKQFFGLGLGNCDYGFDFVTTPFYKENMLTRYYWLTSAHLYVEQGLIGLGLYVFFFIYIAVKCLKKINSSSEMNYYCGIAIIISLESILIMLYNQAMRLEVAFLLYYLMSLPFNTEMRNRFLSKSYIK